MELQIDYLKTFTSLANTGNFTRTGQQIHISQSAVSMQIKRLEDEVGQKLFTRGGKKASLTKNGKILLEYAKRIVQEHDDAVRALTKPHLEGLVRFASPEHYTAGFLPGLLAGFAREYPEVQVEMQCKNSDEIKAGVDAGRLDVGICTEIKEGGLVIAHDQVVWAARPEFVMQPHKALNLAVFEEDCVFRDWALQALQKTGIQYRIAYVSRSVSGLLDAVRAGLAIAPLIKSNVPSELKAVGVESGLPVLPVSNIVLHKTSIRQSEIIDRFAEHLIISFGNAA